MTAHDERLPTTTTNPDASANGTLTRTNRDTVSDTVPVIVWRTIPHEPDAAPDTDADDSPLTSHLAQYLVAIYSDVHSTVVDFDADDILRHAVDANGRRYLAIASPDDLTILTAQRRSAVLIVLRWPRPATNAAEQDAHALLLACQHHLADDGSVIVAVTAAAAGQTGTTYADHERILLAAARAAGLRHLHDIVALTAADGRDSFTYATVQAPTTSRDTDAETSRGNASTTLVIFGRPRTRP
jgi:hypothetical protein